MGLGLKPILAIMVIAAVATFIGERRDFEWRRCRVQQWEASFPICPRACPGHTCTNINSPSGCGTGTTAACTQMVNFISKLLQNKSVHMDVEIKNIRELEFFEEFRNWFVKLLQYCKANLQT